MRNKYQTYVTMSLSPAPQLWRYAVMNCSTRVWFKSSGGQKIRPWQGVIQAHQRYQSPQHPSHHLTLVPKQKTPDAGRSNRTPKRIAIFNCVRRRFFHRLGLRTQQSKLIVPCARQLIWTRSRCLCRAARKSRRWPFWILHNTKREV